MKKEKSDGSHADYYKLPEGATQLQDLISYRSQNAQIGEIFRACYRYGLCGHSDEIRDIKKILFYAQAELDRLEKMDIVPVVAVVKQDCKTCVYDEEPYHFEKCKTCFTGADGKATNWKPK